ncbi:MAG: signal transduction protein, partial [Pseudomonadota bacterium]
SICFVFSALGSLCLLMGINSAAAQTAEGLARADANGDGSIEWQEVLDMRSSGFERMDRNSDGLVNETDRPRFGPGKNRFQEAFDQLASTADTDNDGSITKSEMMDAPAPLFESADSNADGVLAPDELSALGDQSS